MGRLYPQTTTPLVDGRGAESEQSPNGHLNGVVAAVCIVGRVRINRPKESAAMAGKAANTRQTGQNAASAASKVLADPKSTKAEKTAAASALAQTPKRK